MKITTKIGDDGKTFLGNGKRVSKASCVIAALGDLDELQAFLGLCRCKTDVVKKKEMIFRIQKDIYRIMAIVGNGMACPKKIKAKELASPLCGVARATVVSNPVGRDCLVDKNDVRFLEKEITALEKSCGNICEFVVPGKNEISSYFHIARSVCRRAERSFVAEKFKGKIAKEILKYLNRLSDLMFLFGT